MDPSPPKPLDPHLYRRGQFIGALARWISLGLGLLALLFLWNSPQTRPGAVLAVGAGYLAVYAACRIWLRRSPRSRPAKVVHDVADALAVGLAAASSGGLASPVWLLLYPHVVAVSVRGGLAYALAFGALDAAIVLALTSLTPAQPLGALHAVALLFCGFMGGTTSSYLHEVQRRLRDANLAQVAANERLQATLEAQEAARAEQEATLARLRESEARYRRLIERIQDGVVIVQDGRIRYANRHFAELLGDAPEGVVGADLHELADPPERAAWAERYRRWQQGLPDEAPFEARLRTRSGALRLVSLRVGTAEFEGRPAVVATVRDVTRPREMEQDLRAHAERLAAINEIANAVNLRLTIEDILTVAAREARRLVPFDRLSAALFDDDPERGHVVTAGGTGRVAFERAAAPWAFERLVSACEGGPNPPPPGSAELLAQTGIRSLATVPLLAKERVIGSLNFGRLASAPFSVGELDVLEPVAHHLAIAFDDARLLEAVRRRGREFQSLLEISRGILERLKLAELLPLVARSVTRVMGTQNCMLMLRRGQQLELAAQEGFEPEAVAALGRLEVGVGLSGWVAQHGLPLAIDEIRDDPRVRVTGLAERFGYRSFLCVPLKRGREVLGTLSVVSRTPRRFGPEPQELMQAFADQAAVAIENARLFEEAHANLARVSEANRRLEELDRLRQQYLRNVSHEFRTPLTVIKGYAEYLTEAGPSEPAAQREVMRVIMDSCDRVIDMVDTLLEVSRLEQGGEPVLALASADLAEVAREAAAAVGPVAERKGVQLVLELKEPLRLQADSGLLRHLARKLLDNAVKYSAPGSSVVVRARGEGESLELEVEDAGIGIAAEHLPHIFEKFYMVDGGIARRVGGAGVGLYLVREIVRLHGGKVDVRSRPGRGTVFSVTLPRTPQTVPAAPATV